MKYIWLTLHCIYKYGDKVLEGLWEYNKWLLTLFDTSTISSIGKLHTDVNINTGDCYSQPCVHGLITALLPGHRTLHVVNITWHALEVMQTFDLTLESITILHVVSFVYVARSLESVLVGLGYPLYTSKSTFVFIWSWKSEWKTRPVNLFVHVNMSAIFSRTHYNQQWNKRSQAMFIFPWWGSLSYKYKCISRIPLSLKYT